jgi:cellulose synthase/poly-beta-1,6-N-acetylglucosamine synthase-like glycosyltransferase
MEFTEFIQRFQLFFIAFMIRYFRLIVNGLAFATMKAIPIPEDPTLFPTDVTAVVPTNAENLPELMACLFSIQECGPTKMIVVTKDKSVKRVIRWCKKYGVDLSRLEIIAVPKLNKRVQMVAALRRVLTAVTVFADDDVIWPSQYLTYLLAPFEDPDVGAAGTRQRVLRGQSTLIHFLGTAYLERRNFMTCAFNTIDGSVSTLSGRTSVYRTSILRNETFYDAFVNANWFGRPLNSDDDKFLTRWVFSHGWKIRIQSDERSVLLTSLAETYTGYDQQCVRWARAHWRGNLVVMTRETYWFTKHWWSFYAVYMASFQTPAIVVDGILFWLLYRALEGYDGPRISAMIYLAGWIVFTKLVKLIPHFRRHPEDLRFLPASIAFSYIHGGINLYALATIHNTKWGSRKVEDSNDESEAEFADSADEM